MAKAIICDMCGDVIKNKKDTEYVNLTTYTLKFTGDRVLEGVHPHEADKADLCLVCATRVHNFIFNNTVNKKESKNA